MNLLLPWTAGTTIWCSEKGEKPAQWVVVYNTLNGGAQVRNLRTLEIRHIWSDTPMQIKRKEIIFL